MVDFNAYIEHNFLPLPGRYHQIGSQSIGFKQYRPLPLGIALIVYWSKYCTGGRNIRKIATPKTQGTIYIEQSIWIIVANANITILHLIIERPALTYNKPAFMVFIVSACKWPLRTIAGIKPNARTLIVILPDSYSPGNIKLMRYTIGAYSYILGHRNFL